MCDLCMCVQFFRLMFQIGISNYQMVDLHNCSRGICHLELYTIKVKLTWFKSQKRNLALTCAWFYRRKILNYRIYLTLFDYGKDIYHWKWGWFSNLVLKIARAFALTILVDHQKKTNGKVMPIHKCLLHSTTNRRMRVA